MEQNLRPRLAELTLYVIWFLVLVKVAQLSRGSPFVFGGVAAEGERQFKYDSSEGRGAGSSVSAFREGAPISVPSVGDKDVGKEESSRSKWSGKLSSWQVPAEMLN